MKTRKDRISKEAIPDAYKTCIAADPPKTAYVSAIHTLTADTVSEVVAEQLHQSCMTRQNVKNKPARRIMK